MIMVVILLLLSLSLSLPLLPLVSHEYNTTHAIKFVEVTIGEIYVDFFFLDAKYWKGKVLTEIKIYAIKQKKKSKRFLSLHILKATSLLV